jgi:hypothetical protein
MYPRPRISGYSKHNAEMQWALPDRVFFSCGPCHILAYAFLEQGQWPDAKAVWIKPSAAFKGNHIVVTAGDRVFDYHGISAYQSFLSHTWKRARHYWPDWNATLVDLPIEVLISEEKSRTFEGLWLREPGQFHQNALPRASSFIDRTRI